MMLYIALGIELVIVVIYWIIGSNKYAEFLRDNPYPFKLKLLQPAALLLVDQTKLMERLPDLTTLIHHKLLLLYGRRNSLNMSKMYAAEMISASYGCLLLFTGFAILAGGDGAIAALGLLAAGVTPFLLVRELSNKIKKKQQRMIMELPEVLNIIVLLVNAGETVKQAWMRCLEMRYRENETSPLLDELSVAAHELEMNISFSKVMEDFSKRCALQEVSLFTSTLLLNYKRGGNDLVHALQALAHELWQRRKSVSRTLGEEASSKLVFPMVLIFVVVMVIVATPALLMMNE
ncbi:hypothetical protein D3C73_724690 [compost metagenome]